MPDADGKLTPEEKEKCLDWISKNISDYIECPICKTTHWDIADHLVRMNSFDPERPASVIPAVVYPFFQLCCKKCANTFLINSVDAGITPNTEPATAPTAEAGR